MKSSTLRTYTAAKSTTGLRVLKRFEGEVHSTLKQFPGLELKVVVSGIPENMDAVGYAQMAIVELDLHVDDVRDASLSHLDHLQFVPDTSPNRNAVSHPGHVHISSLQHAVAAEENHG